MPPTMMCREAPEFRINIYFSKSNREIEKKKKDIFLISILLLLYTFCRNSITYLPIRP